MPIETANLYGLAGNPHGTAGFGPSESVRTWRVIRQRFLNVFCCSGDEIQRSSQVGKIGVGRGSPRNSGRRSPGGSPRNSGRRSPGGSPRNSGRRSPGNSVRSQGSPREGTRGSNAVAQRKRQSLESGTHPRLGELMLKRARSEERMLVTMEHACQEGRLWQIRRCLGNQQFPSRILSRTFGEDKVLPLMICCSNGLLSEDPPRLLVRELVEKLADISAVDRHGRTALMHALMGGSIDAADELVSMRADVSKLAKHGETALTFAVMSDNVSMCEWAYRMLGQSAEEKINEQDLWGYTPLCHAAQGGELQAARWLLLRGADHRLAGSKDARHKKNKPKANAKHRKTPILLAASEGHVEILALLYRRGGRIPEEAEIAAQARAWLDANTWPYPTAGESALFEFKRQDLAAIHRAIREGKIAIIESILGNDNFKSPREVMNVPDQKGRNAVLAAVAQYTGLELNAWLEKLVDKYGARIDFVDDSGLTATMLAATRSATGAIPVFKALRQRFKSSMMSKDWIDGEDAEARTALFHCFNGSADEPASILRKLRYMLTGASTNDEQGDPSLMHCLCDALEKPADCLGHRVLELAAQRGHSEIVEWILGVWPLPEDDLATAVNQRSLDGRTALMHSAIAGDMKACNALVKARADICVLDDDGRGIQDYISQAPSAAREKLMQWWNVVREGGSMQLDDFNNGSADGTQSFGTQSLTMKVVGNLKDGLAHGRQRMASTTHAARASVSKIAKKVLLAGRLGNNSPANLAPSSDIKQEKLDQQKSPLADAAVQSADTTITDVRPRHKGLKNRQRSSRSSKRKGTIRWECPRCGQLNVGLPGSSDNKCQWCTEATEPSERVVDTGAKQESNNNAQVVFTDSEGVQLQFLVEPLQHGPAMTKKSSKGGGSSGRKSRRGSQDHHEVVNCYRAGKLESRVKRLHLHWWNGVIEEFGHEYVDGQETAHKTKLCHLVPADAIQDVFTRLSDLCENRAKVVYVGQHPVIIEDAG